MPIRSLKNRASSPLDTMVSGKEIDFRSARSARVNSTNANFKIYYHMRGSTMGQWWTYWKEDGSNTLQDAMDTGDVCTVTLITTAAAAGYSANLTIDSVAVTEEWVGGSAPSEGGSDGLDIYCYTIICIGTGTGDSGFKVIANLTNATN